MAFFRHLVITVFATNLYLANSINIRNVDTSRLLWAPMSSLRKPFVTFINDFNLPTWVTRDQVTKTNTGRRHLKLVRGIPFSIVCGACFQHSRSKPNLNMSISDHTFVSKTKRNGERTFQYSVGINECMMTYLITEPIKKDGTITCNLKRGKQNIVEELTFEATDAVIKEPPEEYELQASESSIELHCPQPENPSSKYNPTVNIWYEEQKPSSPKKNVGTPILSTRPTIFLEQPKYTVTVLCSVYNIFSPSIVHQRRYTIQGSQNTARSEYHVSEDLLNLEKDAEILPPKVNLSTSILTIIILAAIVCLLILVIGTYRFCSAARAR